MHPRIPSFSFQEIRLLGTDSSTGSTKEGRIECSLVGVWIIDDWRCLENVTMTKSSVFEKERVFGVVDYVITVY